MKRPQKLAVMLVPTPPYEICGLAFLRVSNTIDTWLFVLPALRIHVDIEAYKIDRKD